MHKFVLLSAVLAIAIGVSACSQTRKGGALPFEEKVSMDDALDFAQANGSSGSMSNSPIQGIRGLAAGAVRPAVERPSYVPEKEMALVTPPKTILVWTFPHVTEDNVRQFGSWSTIFLNDRYEWVKPTNELSIDQTRSGGMYGTLPR